MKPIEIRNLDTEPLELRAAETGDGMTFSGYAVKYDVPSLPLPFTERVAPGAFTRSLKSRNDIRAYVNHDERMVIGSTRAKTLRIEDRADGLFVEADLPNTSYGNDLREVIQRGDVRTMSFGFSTVKDAWSQDGSERTLQEVRLHEVSVVTGVAAYPQTTASVRSLLLPATRAMVDPEMLQAAMDALTNGDPLTEEQAALLLAICDEADVTGEMPAMPDAADPAAPEPECIDVEASVSIPLSLLRMQLDLRERALA